MLKGHPPGCFHPVSGQNAGLVSHLEWQEWTIFTFINPSANTLVEKENGRAAREPGSCLFRFMSRCCCEGTKDPV